MVLTPAWLRREAWLIGLLALLTLDRSGWAQFSASTPGEDSDLQKIFGRFPSTETGQSVFFEGPIDPTQYMVGPGDRLSLYFWQPRYAEYSLVVNGEGDVSIPMVGMVSVSSVPLSEARVRIENAIAGAMRISRVTISLAEPRRFRVHVTGLVAKPGTYVVPATARVADVIGMAGGLKQEVRQGAGETVVTAVSSQRRIVLRDPNGEERVADLLSFIRGGRTEANPYLRDGETVYVPHPSQTSDQIGVFGAVYEGGLFEHVESDRLFDALVLSGGLRPDADSSSVLVVGGNGTETHLDLRVNPSAALMRPMNAGDRVYVSAFPDTSRNGSVIVVGEVARPGGYAIRVGETTLRAVIQRAGGILPTAAANSARLIRSAQEDPVGPERRRIMQTSSASVRNAFPDDPGLAAEFQRWAYGTAVVDLKAAMQEGSEEGSLTLRDGDSLVVPKGPIGVRVLGAVNKAGEVEWKPDGKLGYYLDRAGGVNRSGWKKQAVVIKARNGSQLRYETDLPIEPGDVVYVPLAPAAQTSWSVFKDVIAVTAQVATVLVVVISLGK
jgi:protein involved in polysaccharide export with SLBB domain